MATITIQRCDRCGAERTEPNPSPDIRSVVVKLHRYRDHAAVDSTRDFCEPCYVHVVDELSNAMRAPPKAYASVVVPPPVQPKPLYEPRKVRCSYVLGGWCHNEDCAEGCRRSTAQAFVRCPQCERGCMSKEDCNG